MAKYQILLFDLDNTLIDDDLSRKYAIQKICDILHENYTNELGEQFLSFDNKYWKDWQMGKFEIPANISDWANYLRARRLQLFFAKYNLSLQNTLDLNNIYSQALIEEIFPLDGAYDTLAYLYQKYIIYIATNGIKKNAYCKLNKIGVTNFISGVVSSEEAKKNKPSVIFFDYLFQKYHIHDKEKVLMIDDSLSSGIIGGINYGIDTVWFNPKNRSLLENISPTMEINHLRELIRKL